MIAAIVLLVVCGIGYAWYMQQKASGRVGQRAYDVLLHQMLSHSVPEVSVAELASANSNNILLDSRSEEEYKVSHLPGAIWIGDKSEMQVEKLKVLSKDHAYVVYCSIGVRSEQAAARMKEAGYDVSNLYGGVFEWSNQVKPLVDDKGAPTKAVHGYNKLWAKWIRNGEVVLP